MGRPPPTVRTLNHLENRPVRTAFLNMESLAVFSFQKEGCLERRWAGRDFPMPAGIAGYSPAINGALHLDPNRG